MTVKLPGFIPHLQLVHNVSEPIKPTTAAFANPIHSGNSFINAGANSMEFPGQPNRSAMRFASDSDEITGPARFAPPPAGGSGNDDDGPVRAVSWIRRSSFRNADAAARLETLKGMRSGLEIEHGIMIDLGHLSTVTGVDTRESQLDYLRGVMESVDEYTQDSMTLDAKEVVRAVHLIASAAFDLADFVSIKKVEHIPLSERVSSMMNRITTCADHLERRIIAFGNMERQIAERFAHIYFVTAVKGAAGDAVRERRASGPDSFAYKAYVANALLRLLDVQERFARLGKQKEEREVMKAVTTLFVHHDVPANGRQWAIGVTSAFLRNNLDQMFGAKGKAKEKFHDIFVRNVLFFIYGNRQFAPTILFNCERTLSRKNDAVLHRRFRDWAMDETHLSDTLARI